MLAGTKPPSGNSSANKGVPKPSQKTAPPSAETKGVTPPENTVPKGDSFGTPSSPTPPVSTQLAANDSTLEAIKERARQIARELRQGCGQQLNRSQWIRVSQTLHRELIPRRKPGRPPSVRITRAYEAYLSGKRAVALYREHIPGWREMNIYRRNFEERKLMAAIRSRKRRAEVKWIGQAESPTLSRTGD